MFAARIAPPPLHRKICRSPLAGALTRTRRLFRRRRRCCRCRRDPARRHRPSARAAARRAQRCRRTRPHSRARRTRCAGAAESRRSSRPALQVIADSERARGGIAAAARRAGMPNSPPATAADVGIDDHGVGRDALAARQPDAAGAAAGDENFAHFLAVADRRAERLRAIRQRPGEAVHAAFDAPDAFALDMRDQHQGRRRHERRRAAIGGVAPEQLAQPRIVEISRQRRPHRRERFDLRQPHQPAKAVGADQPAHAGLRRAQERLFENVVDALGVAAEGAIARGLGGACEIADRIDRARFIGEQIEPGVLVPGVARQDVERPQADMIAKSSCRPRRTVRRTPSAW